MGVCTWLESTKQSVNINLQKKKKGKNLTDKTEVRQYVQRQIKTGKLTTEMNQGTQVQGKTEIVCGAC